ncbi:formate dehydrogenase subunit delta [Mangrovicella endophytica]|uniref:formate dehydrogenase subunit delta n=1 Tax=Mangrovicella endophytica TaxID=2066697 RepID=UPI000C9E0241|nr:formate dehydrogenase subunit delta [Mangrovicella endophytica]
MQRDKLIYMANQIATFFQSAPQAGRAAGVADHINSFWEPRMRSQLFERIDSGNTDGIHKLVLEAAPSIRRPA